jgi:GntR family transcriptional regulator
MATSIEPVKRDRGPAHTQIATSLADAVTHGRLAAGERLPPERELASRFAVSRMTVRHALASLERRGLVARRVGRGGGTFVAEPKLELTGLAGLSDQLRALGREAGARVLSATEHDARTEDASLLGLRPGARVYEILRIRLADRRPVALERGTYPVEVYPGLLEHDLRGSLYELFRAQYDETPVRAVEQLEAVIALPDDAAELGVDEGDPLLRVERVSFGSSGRPLEVGRDLFRADRTRVVWESELARS